MARRTDLRKASSSSSFVGFTTTAARLIAVPDSAGGGGCFPGISWHGPWPPIGNRFTPRARRLFANCLARDKAGSAGHLAGTTKGPEHVGIFLQAPANVAAAGHRPAADPGARPPPGGGRRAPRSVYPDS